MHKLLMEMASMRPTLNIFKAHQKASQLCKHCFPYPQVVGKYNSFNYPQLFRGYNRFSCINRSYVTARDLKTRRKSSGSPMTWGVLGAFLVGGGAFFAYINYVKGQQEEAREKEARKSVGMASIGGPFDLFDTEGNEVTQDTFLGKWIVIYFGFCHCPDICPDQLDKLTTIVEKVNKSPRTPNLQPVFISVDPRRDTKESIKEYLKDFHPDFIGLTGSEEQVKRVCKAYRVYYSQGPSDDDEDYIVDHTVINYLVGPTGSFSDYFGQNKTIDEIVKAIQFKMTTGE